MGTKNNQGGRFISDLIVAIFLLVTDEFIIIFCELEQN